MGRKAVEVVLQQIKKQPLHRDREIVQFSLLERSSSGQVAL